MNITKLNERDVSQGALIPKELCKSAGFRLGDAAELFVNLRTRYIKIAQEAIERSPLIAGWCR